MPATHESPDYLLIIDNCADDGADSPARLASALSQPGIETLTASNAVEGLALFYKFQPRIVLAGLVMQGMGGMELLAQIMVAAPATEVILIAPRDCTRSAVEAIRKGASDFLVRPVAIGPLRERIAGIVEQAQARRRTPQIDDAILKNAEFEGMIGRSLRMREMFARIFRVSCHYRSLLVTGETGTGKDLIAGAIHRLSPAAAGRMVVVNCSAVVETLFESELFGFVKGAFTDATHDKPGLVEFAHGGTLFLDEIGDMPLATQSKLLRVLQNQEVQRVGSLTPLKVDVRIIAASNHDLRVAVAGKRFREDLYYRLSMVEIHAPRLADRKEDLSLLERHFIARFAAQYGKEIHGLTPRARMRLWQHAWPGNVRELENVISHAAMMTAGNLIDVPDLPAYLQAESLGATASEGLSGRERQLILHALQSAAGNLSKAARGLCIGRDALRYKLRRHNLRRAEAARVFAAAR